MPEHRQRLYQLRRRLGLSYQELANFFNMSWSTFRKWENGETPTCHPRHISLVKGLLNGEYDERLHASHEPIENLLESWRRMPAHGRCGGSHPCHFRMRYPSRHQGCK